MNKINNLLQISFGCLFLIFFNNTAKAQIVPDNTLGAEASRLTPNVLINGANADRIDGGAIRGINLFHSFSEFNIDDGQRVYFGNPSGVENIFSRITGNNLSNIFGTLGVDGNANLFLINPNGILFGENSRLDVGGSFVGTTANEVEFGEQGVFSATNPEAPPLLTIEPNLLRFNRFNRNAAIQNNGNLQVPLGRTLALVGSNVNLDNGGLFAPGGRVELGGLREAGAVNLNLDSNNLQLSYPDRISKADISLNNQSTVNVNGDRAGDIHIEGSNVSLAGASSIASLTGNQDSGEIFIGAEKLKVAENSRIASITSGTAQGGDITIDANSLELQDSSLIFTNSFLTTGKTGNINLEAKDFVNISNGAGISTFVIGRGDGTTTGSGGNISIETKDLNLQNGNIIVSTFLGQGNAGELKITATNSVNLSGAFITTSSLGAGVSGSILIETKDLNVENGAGILTNVFDPVNAGFNTLDPRFASPESVTLFNQLISTINPENVGKANSGNLTIIADNSVKVSGQSADGTTASYLSTETFGEGNAGTLKIDTSKLFVTDGGGIAVSTRPNSQGKGGSLIINARDVEISGTTTNEQFRSGLFATTRSSGDAGEIQVNTDKLVVRDGGVISAITSNEGKGGNLTVTATESVEITGSSKNNLLSSLLTTETLGAGDAGTLTIDTGRLVITGGANASVSTAVDSQGKGGSLIVNARDVEISGTSANEQFSSGLFAITESVKNAGEIQVNTDNLIVRDGGVISAITNNQGKGGNVTVTATESVEITGSPTNNSSTNNLLFSNLTTDTYGAGDAGNLKIDTPSLLLQDNAQISTSTYGRGNAGKLMVNAKDNVSLARNAYIFSTVEAGSEGEGGNIEINAANLSLQDSAQLVTVTRGASDTDNLPAGKGDAGNVNIRVTGEVDIADEGNGSTSGIFSSVETGTEGDGGNITIDSASFKLLNGAQFVASTFGQGNAGTIQINADDFVIISGRGKKFFSGLFVDSESTTGAAENIIINSPKITLDDQGILNAESTSGNGGNINLTSDLLLMRRQAQISTNAGTAQQSGDGGNININSTFVTAIPGENSDITTNSFAGNGGRIDVTAQGIFGLEIRDRLTPLSDITAFSELSPTFNGEIILNTPNVDPSQGTIELPQTIIDPDALIAQNPCLQRGGSEFIVTGKGGLPASPNQVLNADAVEIDLVETAPLTTTEKQALNNNFNDISNQKDVPINNKILPAQGWVVSGDEVILTAYAANGKQIQRQEDNFSACRTK
jgi:filamentous hemagglutinin family protein